MKHLTPIALLLAITFTFACTATDSSIDKSTDTDKNIPGKPLVMRQFTDQIITQIVEQISATPFIKETPGKVAIYIGEFENKTELLTHNNFDYIVTRIRNKLSDPFISDKLAFIKESDKGKPLPLKTPEPIYTLTGQLHKRVRQNMNAFYLEYQLTSIASKEPVFTDTTQLTPIKGH